MLKTVVKASHVNNLTDARYFAAWEVDYIGFRLESGHPESLSPQTVIAMKEWLEGPAFVGEFGVTDEPQRILEIVAAVGLDAVQVPLFYPDDAFSQLCESDIPLIQELALRPDTDTQLITGAYAQRKGEGVLFLLDVATPWDALDAVTCDRVKAWCEACPTLVDIPVDGTKVEDFLLEIQPKGIAMKGGEEEKVGYKSFDGIDEVFEALEVFE